MAAAMVENRNSKSNHILQSSLILKQCNLIKTQKNTNNLASDKFTWDLCVLGSLKHKDTVYSSNATNSKTKDSSPEEGKLIENFFAVLFQVFDLLLFYYIRLQKNM